QFISTCWTECGAQHFMTTQKFTNAWKVQEGCLINGEWVSTAERFAVLDKYSGKVIAQISSADRAMVTTAVRSLNAAMRSDPPAPHDRAQVLRRAALILDAQRERMAAIMVAEAGFVTSDAHG